MRMGRHRGHRGWGPPRNRPIIIHRHGRRHRGGGFLGGLLGGVIGGAVVNSLDRDNDRPPQRVDLPSHLDEIIERVTEVPEGATVYLKIEEFRALTDKNMITYQDTVPYCMGRKIEVQ